MKGTLMTDFPLFRAGVAPIFIFRLSYEESTEGHLYIVSIMDRTTLWIGPSPHANANKK